MANFKALCLAGVASLAVTAALPTFARAADLLPSLPPQPIYTPPVPVSFGGFYLRGDVGDGISDLRLRPSTFNSYVPDAQFQQSSLGDSGIIDAGVGYKFNNYFRMDVTGEYRTSAAFHASQSYNIGAFLPDAYGHPAPNGATAYDEYSASIRSVVGLVNGYVDVGTWYGVTPFAGAGVGIANIGVKGLTDIGYGSGAIASNGNGAGGIASDRNQTNFAWALMAGLDFAVTPNLALELSYRYLNMGTVNSSAITCFNSSGCTNEVQHYKLASNDIRLGFRYMFTNIAPPPPVIARY